MHGLTPVLMPLPFDQPGWIWIEDESHTMTVGAIQISRRRMESHRVPRE